MLPSGRLADLVRWGLTIVAGIAVQQLLVRNFGLREKQAWRYMFGLGFIAVGATVIWKREVPVGIAGQPASHVSRGWTAVLLGALVVLLGLAVIVIADDNTFG